MHKVTYHGQTQFVNKEAQEKKNSPLKTSIYSKLYKHLVFYLNPLVRAII